eukprot:TRINITY_DN28977_c0_g1_i1.p1 TRINITY_DN28977_c0_g1~~TRINITY_DN28977_c0_g1_i1.p1  ORF type:complete len:660 (+),score=122.23 TRINITY_DN28977_c0_g1_i1:74-2053(+)
MDAVQEFLRRCWQLHGSPGAEGVFQDWQAVPVGENVGEDLLGAAVFTFAAHAIEGRTLEEQSDSAEGLAHCLALAAQVVDEQALERLRKTVVERTLRRLDAAGDALAARAAEQLLKPGRSSASVTSPIRSLLALLMRCEGAQNLSGRELLDLTNGDVALAVAVAAEALGSPKPTDMPQWPKTMAKIIYQLTTPDAFGWLLKRGAAEEDLNSTPIVELHRRRLEHCRVVAFCFVQFDVVSCALRASEDASMREVVLASVVRAMHNLVGLTELVEPGRLLSRSVALDFMRLGYRFVVPLVRKLIDNSANYVSQVYPLRLICSTFSWLLVHSEADESELLQDSLHPVSAEWCLRAVSRGSVPIAGMSALIVLAANCGVFTPKDFAADDAVGTKSATAAATTVALLAGVSSILEVIRERLEGDVRRSRGCVTSTGVAGLKVLGFNVATFLDQSCRGEEWSWSAQEEGDDWDEEDGGMGGYWPLEEEEEGQQPTEPVECRECGQQTTDGCYGEGYFDGFWYCTRCWQSWDDAPANATLSPWYCTSLLTDQEAPRPLPVVEHRGAAALLLGAPGWLRCGVSGALLNTAAVRIPSACTTQPVAFDRRSLERWHRRSGGRCPITGQPLDLRTVEDAHDVPHALALWLQRAAGGGVGINENAVAADAA